jgi:hypothetical protein
LSIGMLSQHSNKLLKCFINSLKWTNAYAETTPVSTSWHSKATCVLRDEKLSDLYEYKFCICA